MNVKDKRILFELDKNSRATYSQIAKATKTSQETVRYRINSLVKKGIIQKFLTVINTTKLGNSYYQIMLKLQNIDEEKKSNIIKFLKDSQKVAWIGNLEGNYDLAFILYVKNQIGLQNIIQELYKNFSKYIMKKVVSINLCAEFFPRDYLIKKQRTDVKTTVYKSHEETTSLDKTDSKICSLLAVNSRISCVDMAKKIKLSSDAVLQRLKKLKKEEIIAGYSIVLNQEKLNQSHYKLLLFLNNNSHEKEQNLLAFLRMNHQLIAIVKTLAEWDYEIDLEVENTNQLKEFTMTLTKQFSDIIKDYDLIRIINMPKYTFYP